MLLCIYDDSKAGTGVLKITFWGKYGAGDPWARVVGSSGCVDESGGGGKEITQLRWVVFSCPPGFYPRKSLIPDPSFHWGKLQLAFIFLGDPRATDAAVVAQTMATSKILVPTVDQVPTVHLTQSFWMAVAPPMLVANQI